MKIQFFKKLSLNILTASATIALVASCVQEVQVKDGSLAVKTDQQPSQSAAPACAYPDAPFAAAPEWICNPTVATGSDLVAIGSGKSSSQFLTREQCLGSARNQMAQTLEVSVKSMFQQYAASTGSGDTETMDQMSKAVTEQLSKATLRGTNLKRSATSPKGTFYCLVALETKKAEAIAAAAKEQANTSQGNQAALWQQFQAKMSIDEMTRKIDEEEKKEAAEAADNAPPAPAPE